jgi:uncharacterized protein with LGFP repeats
MEDIARLATEEAAPLAGAILGRALYDGRVDAAAALAALPQPAPHNPHEPVRSAGHDEARDMPTEDSSC